MDDSPAGGLQSGEVPPEPCHSPGTGRPLPDLIAIRLTEVPDSWPPYDDEVAIAGGGQAMWPEGHAAEEWAVSGGTGPRRGWAAETGGWVAAPETAGRDQGGEAHGDAEGPGRRGEPRGDRAGVSGGDRDSDGDRDGDGEDRDSEDGDGDRDRDSEDGDGDRDRDSEDGDGDRDRDSEDGDGDRDRDSDGEDGEGEGPGRWPSQFAQVLAEALAGARPASQMTPWTTERARAHIRRLGPLLAAGQRPRVQRVLTSRPVDDVVEIAVIVGFGPRTRALAARLERASPQAATPGRPGRQARWLCTAVESA